MHKELFYVAASRGRETLAVVTSNAELLRDGVMHSDIRQSATDLALKAHCRSLQQNIPSLRELYRGQSAVPELKESGTKDVSKDSSLAVGRIDQKQATGQSVHDLAPGPSHSLGM